MQRRKAVDLRMSPHILQPGSVGHTHATPTQSHGSFQYYTTGKNKRLEPTGRRYDGDAIVAGDAWIPNGTGALIDGTSTVYAGDFVHGKPHGIGTYTFDNGDVYEGEMRDGEIHGVGKYTAAGAECSQTVLYRRNKRVCVQNELKPGTRLYLRDNSPQNCTIVQHIRSWKYSVLFEDYTQRQIVLSAINFDVLRDQPALYSIEHGFNVIKADDDQLELRCIADDENIFDVDV